jgi:hypothetical protein
LSVAAHEERYRRYRDAIRRRVCSVCLDGAEDGTCRLVGEPRCAIDQNLPQLVEAIYDVRAGRESGYAAAVEARVCRHCPRHDPEEGCSLRPDGSCALAAYLPLVVEAIEAVDDGNEAA